MQSLAALSLFLALTPALAVLLLGAHGLPLLGTDPFWLDAARTSLTRAALSLACGWPVGAAASLGLWGAAPAPRRVVLSLATAVLILPPSWMGAGLRGIAADGATLAAVAQAGRAAALVALVMTGLLNSVDPRIGRAARLSGAPPSRVWRLVVLPNLCWPLLASGAAAASFCVAGSALDAWLTPGMPSLDTLVAQAARLHGGATAPAALLLASLAGLPLLVLGLASRLPRAWRR